MVSLRDRISITALQLRSAQVETDLWQRPAKEQPLVLSLAIETDVSEEATSDALLGGSLNYGTVTKAIEKCVRDLTDPNLALEVVADRIAKVVLFNAHAPNVRLELARPRALLSAESVGVEIYRTRDDYQQVPHGYELDPASPNPSGDKLFVRALRKSIVIGVNACERVDEQEVIVDLEFGADEMIGPYTGGVRVGWTGWRQVVKRVESVRAPLAAQDDAQR